MSPAEVKRAKWMLIGALAIVYVVWGSTYTAIAVGIETLPPLGMAAIRFLLAGGIMTAIAMRRGDRAADPIGWPQWRATLVVGTLLLAGGNGGVSWGEQHIDTGLAALLVASVPMWIALWSKILLGQALRRRQMVGLLAGFVGVAALSQPGGGRSATIAVVAVLAGAAAWGLGSVWSRRAAMPHRPLVATGMQMLCGGAVLLVASLGAGEWVGFDPSSVSTASIVAVLYLAVFGSLVAFTAYMWLLSTAGTALTSTYAYVNPVVAVVLGGTLLGERLTPRAILGGLIVLAAVALMVWPARNGRGAEDAPADAEDTPEPDPEDLVDAGGLGGPAAGVLDDALTEEDDDPAIPGPLAACAD